MSEIVLGEISTLEKGVKDAIHLAVYVATAGELLKPGDTVTVSEIGKAYKTVNNPVGIVDPFMNRNIFYGENFYVLVMPKTTSNLRHSWDHPTLPSFTKEPYDYRDDDDYNECRFC